jgi:uncharacterized protein
MRSLGKRSMMERLIYPVQETAQSDLQWMSGKVPAQDGLLARASKRLASEEGLLPELGPTRLDRDLQKYIWNDKRTSRSKTCGST